MNGDDLLETTQADVLAILTAVPSLADIHIMKEDEGDTEARILKKLGTLTEGSTGKTGCVAVVMLPEVTDSEENLPGPPVSVEVKVQVIEQPVINRATSGSGVRSSEAALRVLAALHHQVIGHTILYPKKNPVEVVPVKKGYLSHSVTMALRFTGLQGPGKPLQVQAEMGAAAPNMRFQRLAILENELLHPAAADRWTTDGTTVPAVSGKWYDLAGDDTYSAGGWRVTIYNNGVEQSSVYSQSGAASPELATWSAGVSVFPEPAEGFIFNAGAADILLVPAGAGKWSTDGADTNPATGDWYFCANGGLWYVEHWLDGEFVEVWHDPGGTGAEWTPDLAPWPEGVSVTAPSAGLILTCGTAGASIRYTTDGSYPSIQDGTLYASPITGLQAGTIVRAAAYATGLNPGDCTEILITE